MILALRTDSPIAEFYLFSQKGQKLSEKTWQADRNLARELLSQLEIFLRDNNAVFQDITGLIVYRGPGSFTGLRIGLTVANTWAYSENIPIVGETGDDWREMGIKHLQMGTNHTGVMPLYGSEPRITKPRK